MIDRICQPEIQQAMTRNSISRNTPASLLLLIRCNVSPSCFVYYEVKSIKIGEQGIETPSFCYWVPFQMSC
jgi:hypothetical protein